MSLPLVSVIILNWNGKNHIVECLSSVTASTYSNLEIIVVDNNSTDNSLDLIQGFKNISLIRNPHNIGFCAGNNKGFAYAKGKYIVTLNNDTAVNPHWLEKPVELLERDNSIGIISCRQMDYFNHNKINGLFHYADKHLSFSSFGFGELIQDKHLKSGLVIGANGASSIFRKTLINSIGGFDERFFAYHEDCDISMRAFLSGWKCLYVPEAVIFHKEGSSLKKKNKIFRYYLERNRIWFLYKYFPLSFLLKHLLNLVFWELRVFRTMVLKEHTIKLYFYAKKDALGGLSILKRERQKYITLFKNKSVEFNKFMINKKLPYT
ncbi:MAG: glycosyltransferase family 2 protein [Fibrobacter sp.]|nr:glycosyltransferase family 2 protein [Fibrobacter sp.]